MSWRLVRPRLMQKPLPPRPTAKLYGPVPILSITSKEALSVLVPVSLSIDVHSQSMIESSTLPGRLVREPRFVADIRMLLVRRNKVHLSATE